MSARIVIVEDHPLNRQLLRDLLRHHGYRTEEAQTVDEAWRLLEERPPALVLMDIQLPGGGLNLLAAMRADPSLRQVPVAAVTALAMEQDRERLLSAGFDAYVSKPVDTRALVALVRRLLRETPGAPPAETR